MGETFFNSAAPAGHNFYGCTATNSWTLLGTNLWFGGGTVNSGDCAQFDGNGNLVSAGGVCGPASAVTLASPFARAGSLLISAGSGRQGVASSCSDSGGTLSCPGGFSGRMSWLGGTGTNSRQILGPAGSFSSNFTYRWSDATPSAATLMKIGTPQSGESSLGPAAPDSDYVTPSGAGALQNKIFDSSNVFSGYLPWMQVTTPTAPPVGYLRVYAKIGAGLCWVNASGAESCAGGGGVTSIFGRTGAVTAQTGDYSYAQIANTPSSMPPSGAASGDLSGSYPSPTVSQLNGGAIPSSGMLKANASRQAVQAAAGVDYEAPLTFSGALNRAGNAITCGAASGSAAGCLNSSDWTTFNNKQNALTNPITGLGSTGSMAKFTAGGAIGNATAGTDYAPPTPTASLLKGNGAGGFSGAAAADIVNLFGGCSSTQYLGADGACHTASAGSGYVVLSTGGGAPLGNCAAPSSTNLAVYLDTTNADEWWCYATNAWKKMLSVTGSGPYQVTGATGTPPSAPASGSVACYFDSVTNTQVCLDSSNNVFTMVKGASATSHQFLTSVDANGIQHSAQPAFNDLSGTLSPSQLPNVPVASPVSGPVADPGGPSYYLYNNAPGQLTFNLPAGIAGMQRCYRNASNKSGAIVIAVAAGNSIDLNGANGATGTGTLVSSGALGDSVCLVSDTTSHWYAYVQKGTWSNN